MKSYRIFLASALIALVVVFFLNLPMLLFRYSSITRYEVEYGACREELKLLVEFLEDYRTKADPSRLDIASGSRLYDPDAGYLDVSERLQDAIATIRSDCFVCKDAQWDSLRFSGNRIDFQIVNGSYALVYSPDGRPRYAGDPVWIRRIEGYWYHVSFFR